jgi:methionine synthase II (cobalamin-independent)
MPQTAIIPDKVHLVGSIALDGVEEVFHTVGRMLGKRLKRVPDGEPGGRQLWISWQYPLLRANGFLRVDPQGAVRPSTGFRLLRLAEGVKPAEIRFGELGYAREARASYLDFLAARRRKELPPRARFQVCLPTPMAVISAYVPPPDFAAVEAAYEKAMLVEVKAIAHAIPHRDLCIQWDICTEMILWDGQAQSMIPSGGLSKDDMLARIVRMAAAVPRDVELGFHLCYGDFDAKHFVEPRDAAAMVDLANALGRSVKHKIAFIHMPVPIARTDDAYFRPLAELKLQKGTELYLGVVHRDGAPATRQRIAAAQKYVGEFGVATECGMARARRPETVKELLKIHAAVTHLPRALPRNN